METVANFGIGTFVMKANETDYKRWLRRDWPWFKSNVEYGRGGAPGFPDMLFKAPHWKETLFVEAKVGVVSNGILSVTEIRRDQFAWLREYSAVHGFAFAFVGVPLKQGFTTWVLPYPASPLFKKVFLERKIDVTECLKITSPINTSHHSFLLGWKGRCDSEAD